MAHQTILVLDFGSQYTQLIARRLRELSVYSEILPFNTPFETVRGKRPVGVILSGGPSSVSDPDAPRCDPGIFELGVPVLGICYGMQLMTEMLGGEVRRSGHREFGHALVRVAGPAAAPRLFTEIPDELRVWACVTVEDEGPGIAPDQHERIFEPFVQGAAGYTRPHGGTGLGLAIARSLARMMAGDITLESSPGHGASFTLWLPQDPH